ncbi:MAG: hypothetical protein ACM3SQ_14350 [Betaproteobacteria bacterium]
MHTTRTFLACLLTVLIALSSPAFAQDARHAATPGALAAAVTGHVAQQAADRAAIREALARPQVRDVAATAGVDLNRLDAAVGTLAGPDLSRAASAARDVNRALVGGATTVTFSTTTIIIILLVVILLIVALK